MTFPPVNRHLVPLFPIFERLSGRRIMVLSQLASYKDHFMKQLYSFLILIALMTTPAWAQKKVAIVKLLKGEVDVLTLGKTTKLKLEDWVEDGSVVKTGEKSFVKLIFIDKSQMNIGPGSEMKIEKFGEKDSGVIDLVKGKIRSQVTKDYLQMDRNKSKLFIKTPNAVMGVRGTDFMIATNGKTTSTILFEGAISFNKLENRGETNTNRLEDIVDRGVNIQPGEFSVADRVHPLPTVPSVLNVNQREALEKNANFDTDRAPGESANKAPDKSIVPPGLSGELVSNNATTLKSEVTIISQTSKAEDAKGYVTAETLKPTNGSFLHVDSGVIIAPPPGSVYDPITNSYLPSGSIGTVSTSGDYVPPANVEITTDGKVLVASTDASGNTVVTESTVSDPVLTTNTTINTESSGTTSTFEQQTSPTAGTTTTTTTTTTTASNDILGNAIDSSVLTKSQNVTSDTTMSDTKATYSTGKTTTTTTFNTGN